MHVLTARVRGLPPFTREVSVDLAALSGLVAVTGDVGQGKSTLLDILAPIALYRRFSTRTSALKDRASARDCEIDVTIAHAGSVWRMLIQVDPQFSGGRGKEEAYLWRDGVALNSGKVTEFDDLVQGVRGPDGVRRGGFFPPESVFFSSAFAIQQTRAGKGSAGFFGMDVPGRKALFAYLIGLERIQELARRAGDHRKRLDAKIGDVDRDLAIEAAKVADRDRLTDQIPGLTFARDSAATGEDTAREAVADAQRALADARAVLAQLDTARVTVLDQRTRYTLARSQAERARDTAAMMIATAERVIATADTRRQRAADLAVATAARDTAGADWRRANEAVKQAAARVAELTADRDRIAADIRRLENAASGLDAAREALADAESKLATYAGAAERLAALEAELRTEDARVTAALRLAASEDTAAALAVGMARRDHEAAAKAAGLLDGVPCQGQTVRVHALDDGDTDSGWRDCGTCQFLTSARIARDSLPRLAEALTTAQARETAAREALTRAQVDGANLDALRGRVDQARTAAAEWTRADHAAATARGDVTRATEAVDALAALRARETDTATALTEAVTRHRDATTALDAATTQGTAAGASMAALAGADADLRQLDAEIAALPGYEREHAAALSTIADADASLAQLVVPPEPAEAKAAVGRAETAYTAADLAYADARSAHHIAQRALSQAEGALLQLGDVSARVASLNAQRAALADRRAGFALVESGFGVNGIQALEIDAAGPEVSTITNDLLEACFGSRFSVALRTVQEAKAGRVQREVFDLLVYDGESGGSRPLDEMSGGEQALIDEALRLAIAIFNSRRHGAVFGTLFRDECDGQFHESMAARYPAMLRRAMELGSFDRIYMISHRAIVSAQADARIVVGGGRVTVE